MHPSEFLQNYRYVLWEGFPLGNSNIFFRRGVEIVPPHIATISPTSGSVGTLVTITGSHFDATQGASTVTFNSTVADVSSWSDTQIQVTVPLLVAGPYHVVVTTTGSSNPVDFEVIKPIPVILVHGWCGSRDSFGMMGQFLLEDLHLPKVGNFEYNSNTGIPPSDRADLKRLASRLARYIQDQITELGVSQVDVIAHSMGGLLTRTWMAGLTDVPYSNQIRRLTLAGTPNFGTGLAGLVGKPLDCAENKNAVAREQKRQMRYGSQFLKELNLKWDQEVGKSIFPQNILTIVGCGGIFPGEVCLGDGVVREASATLPLESPDYVVRYVNRIHFSSLVDIDRRDHETYQLTKEFMGTGAAGSLYNAIVVNGLIITPLIKVPDTLEPFTPTSGVRFGKRTPFEDRLPHCTDLTRSSPFFANEPVDPTGWWTLTDVLGGCWVVQVDSRKYLSAESEVNVVVGRPTIMLPLVVVPK